MCIAIYKPAGVSISRKTLQTSFRNNPDGAGFALAHKGRLTVRKGYFSFKAFWADYNSTVNKTNGAAIIHFRIATHGTVDASNCHPFSVNKELAFIHNGIINIDIVDRDKSDTSHFNDYFVKPLVADFGSKVVQSAAVQNLLGASIGDSKLIFLDRLGNFAIINEDLGYWEDGCWYSNKSYCRTKYYTYGGSQYGFWNGKQYVVTESVGADDENYQERIAKRDTEYDEFVKGIEMRDDDIPFDTVRVRDDDDDCRLPADNGGYRDGSDAADAIAEVEEVVSEMLSDDMQERGGENGQGPGFFQQGRRDNSQKWCANCQTYSIVRTNNLCMVCGMDANGGIADIPQMRRGLRGGFVPRPTTPCQRCRFGTAPVWDTYCEECRYAIDTVNAHYIERMIAAAAEREGEIPIDQSSTANN